MTHPKLTGFSDSARTDTGAQSQAATPTLLTDIRIDFGPQDVLGRFFLLADYALRESGVTLGFGTFDEVVETNRTNRDTWRPLLSTFDPRNGLMDPDWAYALIGRNAQGKIVTAQAGRVFDWRHTNFTEQAQGLRLFFDNPAVKARSGEICTVTAPSASRLGGIAAFSGAGWWHPSVRGKVLGALLARVSRAYAYTRWQTDLTTAVMSTGLIEKGFAKQNGHRHVESGFALRNFEVGDYDGAVVWITADENLEDLVQFSAELESSLGNFTRLRSA